MTLMPVPATWLRTHWFLPAATLILLADILVARTDDWHAPRVLEAALLFDLVILVPLLALWCYRAQCKQAALRALGLACLAMWAAGYIVPQQHQHLLVALEWLRPVVLVALGLFEIGILIVFYRAVFRSKEAPDKIADQMASELGLPPFLARLLAWEARLWRSVGAVLKRIVGR